MKISFEKLPPSWEFCFNEECARHDTCIHWQSTKVLPDEKLTATCVLPVAAKMDNCPFYKELRVVQMAWGFSKLFENVKSKDVIVIRRRMWDIFGSRAAYYRYNSGEYKLTPEKQNEIIALFGEYGYTDGVEFDNYCNDIDV